MFFRWLDFGTRSEGWRICASVWAGWKSTAAASFDTLTARVGGLESTAAASFGLITQMQEALNARNGTLADTVVAEMERLDGYLAYHAATLRASVAAIHGNLDPLRESLQNIAHRPQHSYIAPGVDALLITAGYDLILPTDEAGLLAYIMRHGLTAIEPGVREVLRSHLKPGAVAVDAGANIGIHSISMASAVGPSGCVLCFEPLPHLAKALERTLHLNGFGERARVQQMALSDTSGETTLNRAAHGPMSSLYDLAEGVRTEAIPVRMITLDECFAPGARVDLVKMDVEGAEPRVWRGMRRILQDNSEIEVITEWSASHFHRSGEDPGNLWQRFMRPGSIPSLYQTMGQPTASCHSVTM